MKKHTENSPHKKTSWESVGNWYNGIVGNEGHYYHKKIILPGALRLLEINQATKGSLLDLACGQGVLARQLPSQLNYTGIDLSASLIKAAKEVDTLKNHQFMVGDISKKLPISSCNFDFATIILALQNIEHGQKVIQNAAAHLKDQGKFLIILNHPCFRIPRQSSWQVDEAKKIQFRRLDRYYSEMKIPIQMHPGKGATSPSTWSFHHPLATYSQWLYESGFHIAKIEEWCSDKISTGKQAVMENRSREEFPLFMALLAIKMRP